MNPTGMGEQKERLTSRGKLQQRQCSEKSHQDSSIEARVAMPQASDPHLEHQQANGRKVSKQETISQTSSQ